MIIPPEHTCLYCYKKLLTEEEIQQEFHKSCSRKFFGQAIPPELDYTQDEMLQLAVHIIQSQKTIPGVQPKLSLGREKGTGNKKFGKLTIVGLWGEYILKPQTENFEKLPENEDLTMHLADLSGIKTALHSLIRLKSGELAYISKRMDRHNAQKLHMEDMCQLTQRLTEHKYKGSHEQISKIIRSFSDNPGLDVVNFYELTLFCFLCGNNDMHLKNFSLIKSIDQTYELSLAYDLVAAELVVEGDDEELALTLNGKKKNIRKKDLITAMKTSGMNERSIENIFNKFIKLLPIWHTFIDESFLDNDLKQKYHSMINVKFKQIGYI